MSTDPAIKEIQRFLASKDAEVLCISGHWGVGKTYAWQHYFKDALNNGSYHRQNYAYVSLFGLNSLDDLRYAIFESTVPPEHAVSGPDSDTLKTRLKKSKHIWRQTRSLWSSALDTVRLGGIGNALARSAFLLVRDQLICLDDLERVGKELAPRDVLGLVSFLKEQRNCRVVLLLNDEEMKPEKRVDFDRLMEKAIDTKLAFAPTAEEAAGIAIVGDELVYTLMRHGVVTLGITNIRVIKKIERLALRLADHLQPHRPEILKQAVTACLLAGWAVFERDHAPPMEFLKNYNSLIAPAPNRDGGSMDNFVKWRDRLSALQFSNADNFDRSIFDGVSAGYFDEERLSKEAQIVEEALNGSNRDNSFIEAWQRYHGSLTDDDDVVLDRLFQGTMENLAAIDPRSINTTIVFLRDCGRVGEADELAHAYAAALPDDPRSFDLSDWQSSSGRSPDPLDPALEAAVEARRSAYKDERDPKAVLLAISRHETREDKNDIRLLATLPSEAFEAIIVDTEGEELRDLVQTALRIAVQHEVDTPSIKSSLDAALARIASKSPLRARRLRSWGYGASDLEEQA